MIRAGVVGMGFIRQIHAKGYQATEGATLVAVCDTDEAKLKPKNEAAGEVGGGEFLKALEEIGFTGALAIEREAGDDRLSDIKTAIEVLAGGKK